MDRITKKQFIENYLSSSNFTSREVKKEFIDSQIVLPCDCEFEGCRGWEMKNRSLHELELKFKASN